MHHISRAETQKVTTCGHFNAFHDLTIISCNGFFSCSNSFVRQLVSPLQKPLSHLHQLEAVIGIDAVPKLPYAQILQCLRPLFLGPKPGWARCSRSRRNEENRTVQRPSNNHVQLALGLCEPDVAFHILSQMWAIVERPNGLLFR